MREYNQRDQMPGEVWVLALLLILCMLMLELKERELEACKLRNAERIMIQQHEDTGLETP